MKVVRPEWLVESVNAGALLPWQKYIFRPVERLEGTQGGRSTQKNLLDGFVSHADRSAEGPSEMGKSGDDKDSLRGLGLRSSITPRIALPPQKSPLKPMFPPAIHSPSKPTSSTSPVADPSTEALAPLVPHYAAHDSNPNAQRVMANPSWRSAHTSAAPDFIQGFYKNSRLHHLSTWKAELKGLVAEALVRADRSSTAGEWIADEGAITELGEDGVSMKGAELIMRSPKAKGKAKVIEVEDRVIMHCDFDSFFVSAGLVDRPQLRGKPVVVCHSQGAQGGGSSTSEIASSSYEARALGIKNGMR
jgi:DNA repair protein REV1